MYKSGYSINAVNTKLNKEKKDIEVLHKNAYIIGNRFEWKKISIDIENNASKKICVQNYFNALKEKQNEFFKIIPDGFMIKALFNIENRVIVFVRGIDLQKISVTEKYYLEKIINKNIRTFIGNEDIAIKFE